MKRMVGWRERSEFSRGAAALAISGLVLLFLLEGLTSATQPMIYLIEKWSVNGTNGVLVHFDTDANRTYILESTDKLGTAAVWKGLFTNRSPIPGHFVIPDLRPGNHFYRLSVTP